MKKYILGLCIAAAICLLFCGCNNNNAASGLKPDITPDPAVISETPKPSEEDISGYDGAGGEPSLTPEGSYDDTGNEPDGEAVSGGVIEITEKMYVAYINEIYTNTSEYTGKTIKIEGMFTSQVYNGNTYYFVYRVGPGCCGNDGSMCGFEFTFDGKTPKENDWIEVVGELTTYEEEGYTYLSLTADSVTVKEKRGKETVSN